MGFCFVDLSSALKVLQREQRELLSVHISLKYTILPEILLIQTKVEENLSNYVQMYM